MNVTSVASPRSRWLIVTVLLAALGATVARDAVAVEEVPEVERPGDVPRGSTALLKSEKGVRYFLRVPRSYHPKRGARLIVFLHGSNRNGLDYLRTIEARRWAPDDLLLCPNGEKGDDPHGANNFTFGSAPHVAGVTEEVKEAFEVTRTYIGGHSQGGFVTYSVILHHPDLYDGAFPMAGDCWLQNEPNLWEEKPEVLQKQKRIAIAVIHGKKDPVVKFSQGKHAYDVFRAMGYPKLRLFAPERLGHQFGLSPVDEALEWLDAMVGDDPRQIAGQAAQFVKEKQWGWAVQASRRLLELERAPRGATQLAKKILRAAEAAAKKEAASMAKAMEEEPAEAWLPRWYEFWGQYGQTEAAASLVERYQALRDSQRSDGQRLFHEARGLFRSDRDEEARKKLREILQKAPTTYEAHYAVAWLAREEG